MSINFPMKPRKDSSLKGIFSIDGKGIVVGADLLRNAEVQEAKERTKARSCYVECHTCGACGVSRRSTSNPRRYDANAKKLIDCRKCEPFRFHDCAEGWFRDSYGDAEPLTEDVQKMFDEQGARPLIR